MTAMDPLTGKMVTITVSDPGQVVDARERFAMKRLEDESRRRARDFADAAQEGRLSAHINSSRALVRATYPQSDSADETSYEGC